MDDRVITIHDIGVSRSTHPGLAGKGFDLGVDMYWYNHNNMVIYFKIFDNISIAKHQEIDAHIPLFIEPSLCLKGYEWEGIRIDPLKNAL